LVGSEGCFVNRAPGVRMPSPAPFGWKDAPDKHRALYPTARSRDLSRCLCKKTCQDERRVLESDSKAE